MGLTPSQDLPIESMIREEAERALVRKRGLLGTKAREMQEMRAAQASSRGSLASSRAQLAALEAQLAPLKASIREGMTRASMVNVIDHRGAAVSSSSLFDVSSEAAALASYQPCVHETKVGEKARMGQHHIFTLSLPPVHL